MIYPVLGRHEAAVQEGRKGIDLDPDYIFPYAGLAANYLYLDRLDDAERTMERAAERRLEIPPYQRYDIAFLRGDQADMELQAAQGRGTPGFEDVTADKESLAAAYSGKVRRASRNRRRPSIWRSAPRNRRTVALYRIAPRSGKDFWVMQRRRAGRRPRPCACRTRGKCDTAPHSRWRSPETPLTRRRSPTTSNGGFPTTPRSGRTTCRRSAAGSRSIAATRPKRSACSRGRPSYELGVPPSSFHGFFGALYPVYVRGQAYLAAGQGAQAAEEFQKIVTTPDWWAATRSGRWPVCRWAGRGPWPVT